MIVTMDEIVSSADHNEIIRLFRLRDLDARARGKPAVAEHGINQLGLQGHTASA